MVDISLPFYQEISCSGWSIFGYQNQMMKVIYDHRLIYDPLKKPVNDSTVDVFLADYPKKLE
jgi:hypothetical protein